MGDTVTGNPTLHPYSGPIDLTRPYFVGAGGTAMSALAQLCQATGSTVVSGSDATDSDRLARLRDLGCRVTVGHEQAAVEGASCVVYTTVTAHTSEVAAARVAGIPVVHRAQVLQEISKDRRLIAVAGTHGKSTTTAMIATALTALGEDPSYLIGADLDRPGSGARHGKGDLIVAEADESDHSLLFLHPQVAVVTRIAHDHPENFGGLDDHLDAYTLFAGGLRAGGVLVVDADDPTSARLAERIGKLRPDVSVVTFGNTHAATVRIESIERHGWSTKVMVTTPGDVPVVLRANTPGLHHARDAVAALTALVSVGVSAVDAAEALSQFTGVQRRFTTIGEAGGVTVVDCYAHHTNEIAADLEAAGAVAGEHRVIAVCQPSGYPRVRAFGGEIGRALADGADYAVLLPVHGGDPIPGVSQTVLGDAVAEDGGQVRFADLGNAAEVVTGLARPGDIVVLLGTGTVTDLAEPILRQVAQGAMTSVR
ncbi:UDP-N-acetylmuramate--L-alanine ligase [Paractinoplanes rishiriensis]|uniref:UDP-N-acetylmuramate--L-alanine ligase n=1 Tax=Paractinoplanes rishiriensis TaxID=1050105 RepID=A0A919JV75_9ACTN|nr:Mur ligase family protein [Actinoplanes rishiriensis]GIE93874.1 UDP-N-acetylmuramate--L-alanine ligase [Actinoplanes rishiriensis]